MANFAKNRYNEFEELAEEAFEEDDYSDLQDDYDEYDSEADDYADDQGDYEEPAESEDEVAEESAEEEFEEEAALDDYAEEPEGAKPLWYVVHTYSGHEKKVQENLMKMAENRGLQDIIREVVVPMEKVVTYRDVKGKKGEPPTVKEEIKERKLFPGYVFVYMTVTSESWYLVRNTQGVTGFVGHGSDPVPLSPDEVERMGISSAVVQVDFAEGDRVKITDGLFRNFDGIVEEVNLEKQILKVRCSGKVVQLGFGQAEVI